MNSIKIFQVDTFSTDLFSGNPAAVCVLESWLPDHIMQNIAMENNLSETAFIVKQSEDFFIRWFTPTVEIPLCGHATLASAHVLWQELALPEATIRFQTKMGDVLSVFYDSGIIKMDFPSYEPSETDQDLEVIGSALSVRPIAFFASMYGLAVFENEDDILNVEPNISALEQLKYDGIIVTAPGDRVDFVSRFFGPKLGIPEDPVTGGAHCELIPYWSSRLGKKDLIARQLSKRGGELYCCDRGDRVTIGGKAVTYLRGELQV